MSVVHWATILAATLVLFSVYGKLEIVQDPHDYNSATSALDSWHQSHAHDDTDDLPRWALAIVIICVVVFFVIMLILSMMVYAMCVKKSAAWSFPREEA